MVAARLLSGRDSLPDARRLVRTSGRTSPESQFIGDVPFLNSNATVFAEYFHNGFGVNGGRIACDALPADLSDRLARGQVFNVSRDYLAGGMSLEWTPLLTLSPSPIVNLNDSSLYATVEATWSLSDNINLIFGAQMPTGPHGSE